LKNLVGEIEQLIESLHSTSRSKTQSDAPGSEVLLRELGSTKKTKSCPPSSRGRGGLTPVQKAFIHSEIFRRRF
jgi:hypothetical protein